MGARTPLCFSVSCPILRRAGASNRWDCRPRTRHQAIFREEISCGIARPNSWDGVGEKELRKTQKDGRSALV